jgi:hypothetical protein
MDLHPRGDIDGPRGDYGVFHAVRLSQTASFLTEEEKVFVVYRLKYQNFKDERDDGSVRVAQDDSFQWKFLRAAFLDWQVWLHVGVYWGMVVRVCLRLD